MQGRCRRPARRRASRPAIPSPPSPSLAATEPKPPLIPVAPPPLRTGLDGAQAGDPAQEVERRAGQQGGAGGDPEQGQGRVKLGVVPGQTLPADKVSLMVNAMQQLAVASSGGAGSTERLEFHAPFRVPGPQRSHWTGHGPLPHATSCHAPTCMPVPQGSSAVLLGQARSPAAATRPLGWPIPAPPSTPEWR